LLIRRYILAGLSGILLVLGFPEFNFWSLTWVALVPLLVAIHGTSWKQSLWLGFVAGGVYFGGIMNWLMVLVPFSTFFWVFLGYIVLSAYLACYVFLFTVSINYITNYWYKKSNTFTFFNRLSYILLVAITWTGLEVLRGYVASGLPWASLGYTQWKILPIIQISSVVGMYGVTFLICLINGIIALFLIDISGWKNTLKSSIIPLAIVLVALIYGIISLNQPTDTKTIKIGIVPGNIKQKDKMASWGRKSGWIFDKYFELTQKAIKDKPEMIIWPETAVPKFIFPASEELDKITDLLSGYNSYMLIGAISYDDSVGKNEDIKVFNSAYMITPKGEVIDKYDKIHLVPISEQFPFKRYLPKKWQELVAGVSDFDSGSEFNVFHSPLGDIGVPICFESVFPEISREFVKNGANLIGIITNDSWFVGTFAAQQHFSMAPFRAIENRVSVFRCANYGVSCIIDPYGRIAQKLEPENGDEYIIGDVGLYQAGTFYTKHGDYFPWTCLAMLVFLIIQAWWYKYRKFMEIKGEKDVIRTTLSDSGSKRKSHGSRRASLTQKTSKKKQKN
jgi:apolipoprotein N-acyltransferase